MREFYEKMEAYHEDDQRRWATPHTPGRRLGVRICTDAMYVYVHEDGIHIRTLHVSIPDSQMEHWTWSEQHIRRLAREAAGVLGQRVPVDLDQ